MHEEDIDNFYKKVNIYYEDKKSDDDNTDKMIQNLCESFRKAASEDISKNKAIKREFDVSNNSRELIEKRQKARDKKRWDDIKPLTKEIRKSIRKDRTDNLIKNLEECCICVKRLQNY